VVKKYYVGSLLIQRYGHLLTPFWIYGSIVSQPSAGQSLVQHTTSKKYGYIYGFFITASEGNDFNIEWTDINNQSITYRVSMAGKGTVHYADTIPLNEGRPAKQNTTIAIKVVNAGGSGSYYQAGMLVGEVDG